MGPRGRQGLGRFVGLFGGVLLCLVAFAGRGDLRPESGSVKSALNLTPGAAAVELNVPRSAKLDFAIRVPAGYAAVLTLTEEQQTSVITWTDAQGKAHLPRTNKAGRGASVRFTLLGDAAGPQRFSTSSSDPKRGSTLRAVVSAPRRETPQDVLAVSAEASLAKGEYLWGKGDPGDGTEALAAFDSAIHGWEHLGDTSMLRRSLTWKAIELSFVLGKPQEGLPLLFRARSLPDVGDIVEQANVWKTLGFVQTELADYTAGRGDYAKALDLFEKTGDLFNQEVLLENRGSLSEMTGHSEGALEDATAALKLARELNDRVGVLHIADQIGEIHLQRGEMQAAFDAYEQMLALAQLEPSDPMIGFGETDLAVLYHRLGAKARSHDMLSRANAFWTTHPYLLGHVDTLIQQGKIETDNGDLSAAAASYRGGLQLAEPAKMKRETVFCLLGLGTVERERGERAAAEDSFREASQLATAIDEFDALASIDTARADLELSEGRVESAGADYRRALDVATKSYDQTEAVRALGGLARLAYEGGDLATALIRVRRALRLIESARVTLASRDLRTSYFASKHDYYDLAVSILMRLERSEPGHGFGVQAFETAERSRARTLLDILSRVRGSVLAGAPPRLVRQQRLVREELEAAYGLSEQELMRPNPSRAKIEKLRRRIENLLASSDVIESQLRAASHEYAALAGSEPAALSEIRERVLASGGALLEYWVGARQSYLWIIRRRSFASVRLPGRTDLAQEVTGYRRALLARAEFPAGEGIRRRAARLAQADALAERLAARLGRQLLGPVSTDPGLRKLFIVPGGPLDSLPFAALRVPGRRGRRPGAYAIARYVLLEEPSVSVLLSLVERPPAPRRGNRVAIFADPVYNDRDPRLADRAVLAADSGPPVRITPWTMEAGMADLPRLSGSRSEALAIRSLAGPGNATLRLGLAATPAALSQTDWSRYRVAHFATHALLDARHPEFSGIVLSLFRPNGTRDDGVLWLSDIYSLHMPVSLVMLSGCSTARGEQVPGEGLIGLARAFLIAGARSVGGSLWSLDDQPTSLLMRGFYSDLLRQHLSAAAALRAAQLALAAKAGYAAPYYWAGFVLEGAAGRE